MEGHRTEVKTAAGWEPFAGTRADMPPGTVYRDVPAAGTAEIAALRNLEPTPPDADGIRYARCEFAGEVFRVAGGVVLN